MATRSNELNKRYVIGGKVLIWIGIASYTCVIISLFHDNLLHWSGKIDWDTTSKIGGFIGGVVTPIWTLIGGLFIYQTLVYQQKAIEDQEKQIRLQQFETTLLNMMQRQDRIKAEIEFNTKDTFVWIKDDFDPIKNAEKIKGELFFRSAKETFKTWYDEGGGGPEHGTDLCFNKSAPWSREQYMESTPPTISFKQRAEFKSDLFYEYYQSYFDHYFGYLESVFQLIEKGYEENIFKVENDHHLYIRMFKAQFSSSELIHIFYGSQSNRYKTMREFIKKYRVLEKLNKNELFEDSHFNLIYS